jgi:hypothetical protein
MAAELLKRLFTSEIQPKLYPGNGWLSRSRNDDAYVNNNTVELAHAGTDPSVVVDRVQLPATIQKRTDAATNYTLEELTTDPTHIGDSEALVVAYNKRASILDQHSQVQRKKMAERALYKWAAGADATRIIASTGSSRTPGNTTGAQTGSRKAFTENDIIGIQQMFFADNVQNELDAVNGVALITPAQYADLIKLDNFKRADAYGQSNIPNGVVKRAYGFDFYVRSSVISVDASNVLRAEGAAGATTTQDCAIFWSPDYVRRALGAIKVYVNIGEATLYGDVFSTMVRFGAVPTRNDNKGIYLLYEDNV